jgi:hypothetical protein
MTATSTKLIQCRAVSSYLEIKIRAARRRRLCPDGDCWRRSRAKNSLGVKMGGNFLGFLLQESCSSELRCAMWRRRRKIAISSLTNKSEEKMRMRQKIFRAALAFEKLSKGTLNHVRFKSFSLTNIKSSRSIEVPTHCTVDVLLLMYS